MEQQDIKLKQDIKLQEINKLQADKMFPGQEYVKQSAVPENEDKLKAILMNRERTIAEMSQEKQREQQNDATDKLLRTAELLRRQNQNF